MRGLLALLGALPVHCSLLDPSFTSRFDPSFEPPASAPSPLMTPVVATTTAQHAEPVVPRQVAATLPVPAAVPAVKRMRLPDEVVVRALDVSRPSLMRCFARAQREDPLLDRLKITLHLEVDVTGIVTAASTDAPPGKLDNCLRLIGSQMIFAIPPRDAVVDVPLMFGS